MKHIQSIKMHCKDIGASLSKITWSAEEAKL